MVDLRLRATAEKITDAVKTNPAESHC